VNGRISNFRDLVDFESFRYFEGDSDLTWDSTNLLTNPNNFFLFKKQPVMRNIKSNNYLFDKKK
jgi:hypothetical protein